MPRRQDRRSLPQFVVEFLADTARTPALDTGIYAGLLFYAWSHDDRLPNDTAQLIRIAACTEEEWQRVGRHALHRFELSDDELYLTPIRSWREAVPEEIVNDPPPPVLPSTAASVKTSRVRAQAIEVLTFMNAKAGKHWRTTDSTLAPIIARLKEGFTVQECRAVFMRKFREWSANDEMRRYIRPATIFAASNFANYVGDVPPAQLSLEATPTVEVK